MAAEAQRAERPPTAEQDEVEDEDEGSWGNLLVNLYYALVNLGVMLGAMALIMVAYWLLKWATVSAADPPGAHREAAFGGAACCAAEISRRRAASRRCLCRIAAVAAQPEPRARTRPGWLLSMHGC